MEPATEARVDVSLGSRSYPILIGHGLMQEAGRILTAHVPGARAAIVTDENVARIHLPTLSASLQDAQIAHEAIVLPAGEATKRFAALERVVDEILSGRFERNDVVVALGGGVIGDLAGFAASIVRRGMRFVQVPTSLLAQVDSSVGGKTGINTSRGKNLVGAFQQPAVVIADTDVLDTLPAREFRAGYAEVAKYGLIDNPDFFTWLEQNWRAVFSGGQMRVAAIETACRAKAHVVARDEYETGDRALLNLGHTFAHALEAAVSYDGSRLVHGEAVAIGMVLAHRFSLQLGLLPQSDVDRVENHLSEVGLPVAIADIPGDIPGAEALLSYIQQDKKVSRGALTFILSRGIGRAFVARDVETSAVLEFLKEAHPV